MNQTVTLRDELIALIPTISALGLTAAQVVKEKREVVESFPLASIYIDSVEIERDSRECVSRQPSITIQIFYVDGSDIQQKLVNMADAIEQGIFDASLSGDCFVSAVRFAFSPDSTRQGSASITVSSWYSTNLSA